MSFRKTASVESLGAFTLTGDGATIGAPMTKVAGGAGGAGSEPRGVQAASHFMDGSTQIDVSGILERVAGKFAISADPRDFVYEAIRANSTNVPNDNHDAFTRDELLRFVPRLGMAVYQTYREKPHHVNHRTENAKTARGVILDAHYNDSTPPLEVCPTEGCGVRTAERANRDASGIHCITCKAAVKDEFVEILLGIDAKKDPLFAEAVRTGELRTGSMGCNCAFTECNVCDHVARTKSEFCQHIRAKGSLWGRNSRRIGAGADSAVSTGNWRKISLLEAEREFAKRGRRFNPRNLVSLIAQDFEVRKAHEKCGDVEYDEYSRVDLPADPTAEQIEFFGRAAAVNAATASEPAMPTPEELTAETEQLIMRAKRRPTQAGNTAGNTATNKAAQVVVGPATPAAPNVGQAGKYYVVRIDEDPTDVYAAITFDEAMELASPAPDSIVEFAVVDALNEMQAKAKAVDPSMKWQAYDGMGLEGDVTININDQPGGEPTIQTTPDGQPPHNEQDPNAPPSGPGGPQSIEDFTENEMDPGRPQNDEELTPEELGVIPPGASKDADALMRGPATNRSANMHWNQAYQDWKIQVSPRGNAQLVSPQGDPMLLIRSASTTAKSDEERLAFGQAIHDDFMSLGLTRVAAKYDAVFADKWASVVDFAADDMAEFADKQTKDSVAGGGERDHVETLATPSSDIRDSAERDMAGTPGAPKPQVGDIREERTTDMKEHGDKSPDSLTSDPSSDMRDPRPTPPSSVLDDEQHDHKERVGKRVAHKDDAKRTNWLVASVDADGKYLLANSDLETKQVTGTELRDQWLQLDKTAATAAAERRAASDQSKFEARIKKIYASRAAVAETAARDAAIQDVFRALRIAARRHALNLEASPLKEALGIVLANGRVVGSDAVTGRALEYEPIAPDLAVHLVEAGWKDGSNAEIDTLINRAAELMKKDSEYLKSAESDLAKIAHRIPQVTSAAALSDVDAHATDLRRQASAGNLELRSADVPAAAATISPRESIQAALSSTRLATRRNQFRQ